MSSNVHKSSPTQINKIVVLHAKKKGQGAVLTSEQKKRSFSLLFHYQLLKILIFLVQYSKYFFFYTVLGASSFST